MKDSLSFLLLRFIGCICPQRISPEAFLPQILLRVVPRERNSAAGGSETSSVASGSETSSAASGSETSSAASGSEPSSFLRVVPRQILLRVVPARQILLRNDAASGSETSSAASGSPETRSAAKSSALLLFPGNFGCAALVGGFGGSWRREFCCGCLRGRLLLRMRLRGVNLAGHVSGYLTCWAEARLKIARMTLTIKLDGNWSSFQLANSAPPLSVTGHAIAPPARMALQTA